MGQGTRAPSTSARLGGETVISFRYHLVSVVAVLFALAIGIVIGSGFLGDILRREIRAQVRRLAATNADLRLNNNRLTAFAEAAEPMLTRSKLVGEEVVVVNVDGTDGPMVDGLTAAVESAGGRVALTITVLDKLALATPEDRTELATMIDSDASDREELRRELGSALGVRAAAAAAAPATRIGAIPDARLETLLRALEDASFVSLDALEEGDPVPTGGLFLVTAGNVTPPPYSPVGLLKAMAAELGDRGAGVLAAEPSQSTWGLVDSIRDDGRTTDDVSTVDGGETVPGRIATVLALDLSGPGDAGHYGIGAGSVLPEPAPRG